MKCLVFFFFIIIIYFLRGHLPLVQQQKTRKCCLFRLDKGCIADWPTMDATCVSPCDQIFVLNSKPLSANCLVRGQVNTHPRANTIISGKCCKLHNKNIWLQSLPLCHFKHIFLLFFFPQVTECAPCWQNMLGNGAILRNLRGTALSPAGAQTRCWLWRMSIRLWHYLLHGKGDRPSCQERHPSNACHFMASSVALRQSQVLQRNAPMPLNTRYLS